MRRWLQSDLYFLLRYGLKRLDIEHPWLFERCREVQAEPDGCLDLWAREHFKSSIITVGLTIQDILNDPEITVGIFSQTRGLAESFLWQIKREFEQNEYLKALFPDILYLNPERESPQWSNSGIMVKRRGNPKEATVEAWPIVEHQPTGRHFKLMIYDDVVTRESVGTPDQIRKTTDAWELSRNLTTIGGRSRYIGTRYHFNDTYGEMMRRKIAKVRLYPATVDGTVAGEGVLMSRDLLDQKRNEQGPYNFACQMLQDPKADETQGFKTEWLRYYEGSNDGSGMNIYILVDAASEKKKESDYTAMMVVGLGSDKNYYLLEMVRDRLNLPQRAEALFGLHRKWGPKAVGYEKYGQMADVEHMQYRMQQENYRFNIIQLGGQMPKHDRIRRLIPLFEQGRIWLPVTHFKTNYEGLHQDLTLAFAEEEYKPFPVAPHEDMLDALARLEDEDFPLTWPKPVERKDRYQTDKVRTRTWMSA